MTLIPERDLLATVIEMARAYGWLVYHARPAIQRVGQDGKPRWVTPMQGDKGFPDLVLVRPPNVLFIELKAEKGRVSRHQQQWLDALGRCSVIRAGWLRPGDMDEVEQLLKREIHAPAH